MTYSAWRDTAAFTTWKGHQIAYYSAGTGPVITLIHGFPTSSHDWSKIWHALAQDYRLIAVDQLGFGASDKPRPHDYRIADQAAIFSHVWDLLGVAETALLAHDYGDTVALELLAQQKAAQLRVKINAAMLLNGGIVQGAYRPRRIQHLMASPVGPVLGIFLGRSTLGKNFHAIFGTSYPLSETELDEFWAGIAEKNGKWALPYIGRYLHERKKHAVRWAESIAKPEVPLHLFWGGIDPISGAAVYEGIQRLNPAANGPCYPEVGHYPQWEKPDELVQLCREVL